MWALALGTSARSMPVSRGEQPNALQVGGGRTDAVLAHLRWQCPIGHSRQLQLQTIGATEAGGAQDLNDAREVNDALADGHEVPHVLPERPLILEVDVRDEGGNLRHVLGG